MQFLSIASAWFAAALPAIAAMYLLKRTYENKIISSHLLWKRVLQEQKANRPWQKLRSRWLLLLQLLIAIILVLALMEPVLTRPAAPSGHAVLLIDRSASMASFLSSANQASSPEPATRLELAIKEAEHWIDLQTSSRPITLVATGAQPEVLANRQTNKEEIIRQLRDIVPFYGKSDQAAALSLADSLLLDDPSGEIVIYTDGHWSDALEANKLKLQASAELNVLDDSEPSHNLSIAYFGIKSSVSSNGKGSGVVTLRNDGGQEKSLTLEVYAVTASGERILAAEPLVSIPAEEWESVELSELPEALYYKAQIKQSDDIYLADNTAYQFPAIPRKKQALLITDGNLFLEKALQLAGVQTVKISPDSPAPTGEQANKIDWIVWDGLNERLAADQEWSKLLDSKPVWMIDHPEQADKNAAVPANNRVVTKEHTVTSYLSFADTHIGRLAQPSATDLAWGEPVLSYGGIPAIYAGTYDGKPRLRFTFNFQDTDLPLRPEFPVLIVQAAEWMSGGLQLELGSAIAGQQVELSLHSDTVNAEWNTVELAASGTSAGQQKSDELEIDAAGLYPAPSIPGLYRLIEKNKENAVVSDRLLAVTADQAELMNLASSEEKLQLVSDQAAALSDATETTSPDQLTIRKQQLSLQLYAAILLLLVLAAEWEVYRRGISS